MIYNLYARLDWYYQLTASGISGAISEELVILKGIGRNTRMPL